MAKNKNLHKARTDKQNEFYTQLEDIAAELKHYKSHFKGKVVYCNCDDPRVSNFFHYFSYKFKALGLKKLVTTCFKNQYPEFYSRNDSEQAIKLEYNGPQNGNRVPTAEEIGIYPLKGNGDFRSKECIDLLRQADIVCTNPPFSLFREYVAQLVEYDKKFLIIGNQHTITYTDIFPLIRDNKVWYGCNIKRGNVEFGIPDYYQIRSKTHRVDEKGNRFLKVAGIRWLTNLDHSKRHNNLILTERYTPEKYPTYDNYDAINVDKTEDIPKDYVGIMGVPISFLDKHNPDQFDIIALTTRPDKSGLRTKKYTIQDARNHNDLNGGAVVKIGNTYNQKYARILIRNKNPK